MASQREQDLAAALERLLNALMKAELYERHGLFKRPSGANERLLDEATTAARLIGWRPKQASE